MQPVRVIRLATDARPVRFLEGVRDSKGNEKHKPKPVKELPAVK